MTAPRIAIKLYKRNYTGLINLGNAVDDALTDNPAYVSPQPSLAALRTAIDAVSEAVGAWGSKSNRGSHAALSDLREKSTKLALMLKSLSHYVENTAQNACGSDYLAMADMIATSGFGLRRTDSPQGRLEMVKGFKTIVSRKLSPNQLKLAWKKPLNTTSAGNVKTYKIYRAVGSVVFSEAALYATCTRTSLIYTNNNGSVQTCTFWIVPVNAAGEGVASDAVTMSVLSI